jgi:pilus assembly protein FimV
MTLLEKVQAFLTQYKLQALLASLGLLLALFFLGRKRTEDERKVTWDEAVENINIPAKPVASVVAATAAVDVVEEIEPEKTVDDLIKDADVYVSYGDFEKAGLALEEAHSDEPSNMAVIQKLLFIHYKQGKTNAFVGLARDYTVERDSMEWAEVADWGRELDNDNVLLAEPLVEEPVIDLAEVEAGLEFDQGTSASTIEEKPVSDIENDLLDFDIDIETSASEATDVSEDITDVEIAETVLDVDTTELEGLSLSLESDDNDSLELEGLEAITDGELEAASLALSGDDADELEFDLSDFDQVDEAETKLDLATAYIEMGDPSGAKSILEEIMAEGNDEQQSRAKTLLSELS